MEETNSQPNATRDARTAAYMPLLLGYAAATVGLSLAARATRRDMSQPMGWLDLAELAVSTYAASHIVAREKVGTVVREPFVEARREVRRGERPAGDWRAGAADLITCTRCVGVWIATALTWFRILAPRQGAVLLHVLTAVGANNFLQAVFSLLTSKANAATAATPDSTPERPRDQRAPAIR